MPHFADPKVGDGAGALGAHQPGLLAAHEDPVDPARRRTSCSSTAAATAPGCFFNFNGTAGIWRREAIADAGGWQHDTLTEDLDLSYRAQLRGWRFVFLPDLVAPAEVPVEMNAFKSQQHRWAKGSIQTCRKLLPRILRSNLPLGVKAEAFFHLTANFNYPLMCVLSVLMFPSMVIRYNMGWYEMLLIDMPLFFAATVVGLQLLHGVPARDASATGRRGSKYLPFLMSIGIGLCVNNTRAVFEALFDKQSEFARTPKYRIEGDSRRVGRQEVPPVGRRPAAHRAGARPLFHRHGLLRARQRHLRHVAVPGAVPDRLPLHRPALDHPAVRGRRRGAEGRSGEVASPSAVSYQLEAGSSRIRLTAGSRSAILLSSTMATATPSPRPASKTSSPRPRPSAISTAIAACSRIAATTSTISPRTRPSRRSATCCGIGRLPTRAELGDLQSQLAAARPLPEAVAPADAARCRRSTAWTRCGR